MKGKGERERRGKTLSSPSRIAFVMRSLSGEREGYLGYEIIGHEDPGEEGMQSHLDPMANRLQRTWRGADGIEHGARGEFL